MLQSKYFLFSAVLILLSFSGIFIYHKGLSEGNESFPGIMEVPQDISTANIRVHIDGAIKQPGVYEISSNTHVYQLILIAGGILPQANLDKINLAKVLKNGDKVSVPTAKIPRIKSRSEKRPKPPVLTSITRLSMNAATLEEWDHLPGISPKVAQAIVEFRYRNGPFQSIEELLKIKGIGTKTLDKIRQYLSVP